LTILQSVLGEAKRKNSNCLSPAQQDEFLNFSEASHRTLKMGKRTTVEAISAICQSERISENYYKLSQGPQTI
jgi:hypothetical protein